MRVPRVGTQILIPIVAFVLLSSTLTLSPTYAAPSPKATNLGADCNNINHISGVRNYICADPLQKWFYNAQWQSVYIGHDEPSQQYFSSAAGSASNLQWVTTLPGVDPVAKQDGSSVATFENYVTYWFSLDLCDSTSYPQGACIAASDANNPNLAGNALLELQFYPPGFETGGEVLNPVSCSATQWCAAINIDSLECTAGFLNCNPNCTEPVNFALIQKNGVPAGPPGPANQNALTFTPNSNTLLMNPSDKITVTLKETANGLETDVNDLTTATSGFMVASSANGFQDAVAGTAASTSACSFQSFSFHPEFSTASTTNIGPWEALSANVNFAIETGHFELCGNSSCSILPDGSDADDVTCFTGPPVGACFAFASAGELDFDGLPYTAKWPDGTATHPSSIVITPPLSFLSGSYSSPYAHFVFQTDVPASESTANGAGTTCNTVTGTGCTVPPKNGAGQSVFYPFYSSTSSCNFIFGNDQPATLSDYGKTAQYGSSSTRFHGTFESAMQTTPTCAAVVQASIKLTIAEAGSPTATFGLSGCSVSISSVPGDGAAHSFTALPSCLITVTAPAPGPSTRYVFAGGSTTASFTTCTSGTCPEQDYAYFFQFNVPVSFFVSDGSTGFTANPVLTVKQFGANIHITLSTTPTNNWLDASSAWSAAPTALAGSTSTQRWQAGTHTGTITSASAINVEYFHQFNVPVSFSVSDGSTGFTANPLFTSKAFGVTVNRIMTTTPTSFWFDAGTAWSVSPTVLAGSSSTQRWILTGAHTGTITSASAISILYTHQYFVTFVVTPTGAGSTSPTGWYNANTPDSIHATANSGHSFVSWSATAGITFASSTAANTKMTVTASGTVTATFT